MNSVLGPGAKDRNANCLSVAKSSSVSRPHNVRGWPLGGLFILSIPMTTGGAASSRTGDTWVGYIYMESFNHHLGGVLTHVTVWWKYVNHHQSCVANMSHGMCRYAVLLISFVRE